MWDSVVQLRGMGGWPALRLIFLGEENSAPTPQGNISPAPSRRRPWHILPVCIQIVNLVFFILMVELPISWNGMEKVHTLKSTGQIIPLVVGLASLGQNYHLVFSAGPAAT